LTSAWEPLSWEAKSTGLPWVKEVPRPALIRQANLYRHLPIFPSAVFENPWNVDAGPAVAFRANAPVT
jgi:hypothetical protein